MINRDRNGWWGTRAARGRPARVAAGLAVLVAAALGGCSNDEKGKGDAPVQQQPDHVVRVWPNGDGFPNIAAFCIGADAIYSTTREAAPVVVKDSANCAEGGILASDG